MHLSGSPSFPSLLALWWPSSVTLWIRVSPCSPDLLGTLFVDQANLKLTKIDLPTSAPRVLGSKARASRPAASSYGLSLSPLSLKRECSSRLWGAPINQGKVTGQSSKLQSRAPWQLSQCSRHPNCSSVMMKIPRHLIDPVLFILVTFDCWLCRITWEESHYAAVWIRLFCGCAWEGFS